MQHPMMLSSQELLVVWRVEMVMVVADSTDCDYDLNVFLASGETRLNELESIFVEYWY